jgi:hypothetical protein
VNKYVSRATDTSRTLRYRVWSLDVWGHSSADCPEAPGPCDDDDHDSPDHECTSESYECECGGYDINDRASQGYIEITADGTEYNVGTSHAFVSYCPTDDQILAALRDAGHFNAKATTETVVVDGDPEYGFDVDDAGDGKPIYKLERAKDQEEENDHA